MTEIIEEREVYVAPDEWKDAALICNPMLKARQRAGLQMLIDKYLAEGGQITECEVGECTLKEAVPLYGATNQLERVLSPQTRRARKNDIILCAKIDEIIAAGQVPRERGAMADMLGVPKEKLRRLIERHYHKHPALAHLCRPPSVELFWETIPGEVDRWKERIAQGARLGMGRDALCKWMGTSWHNLIKFSKRYRVELPLKKPGNPNGNRKHGRFCKKEQVA